MMPKLEPCPKCGGVPQIGYACGEYFIIGEKKDCTVCGVCSFVEMHASEEMEIEAWNRRVSGG